MINFHKQLLIGLAALMLTMPAFAKIMPQLVQTDQDPWSGNFDLGYVADTGDSSDSSISSAFNIYYMTPKWNDSIAGDLVTSSDSDGQDEKNYSLAGEANYFFKPNTFVFSFTNAMYDYFATYDVTLNQAVGIGQRIFNKDQVSVELQAGPGVLRQREANTKLYTNEATLFTKQALAWQVSKSATLQEYILGNWGNPNSEFEANVSLNTTVSGNWGINISYTAFYDTYIPPNSLEHNKLGTLTQVAVSYDF